VSLPSLMRKDVLLLHDGGGQSQVHGRPYYINSAWRRLHGGLASIRCCAVFTLSVPGLEIHWNGHPRAMLETKDGTACSSIACYGDHSRRVSTISDFWQNCTTKYPRLTKFHRSANMLSQQLGNGAMRPASQLGKAPFVASIAHHMLPRNPRAENAKGTSVEAIMSSKRCVVAQSAADATATAPSTSAPAGEREIRPGVFEGFWSWKGHKIRYQRCGNEGEPLLLVHGFGGNADHWRKNLPELGATCRAYAIDLLGYGYSDKPDPRSAEPNSIYNFENWGDQLRDFIGEKMGGEPAFIICNSGACPHLYVHAWEEEGACLGHTWAVNREPVSLHHVICALPFACAVGGLAGLQAAVQHKSLVRGVQVINISLRMLHLSKQAAWQRPLVAALQRTLRETSLGQMFFGSVATAQVGMHRVHVHRSMQACTLIESTCAVHDVHSFWLTVA
jgi:pimeloyl-ACP methyl ester carboxylesterase